LNIKLYIGSSQAEFNETFNVMFSVGDIRQVNFGNANRSYTLNIPLTKTNKALLKHVIQPGVKTEPSATARLYIGEIMAIAGTLKIQTYDDYFCKAIIESDTWIEELKDKKMTELDLSASDHALTHQNVEDSWSASYPIYRYPMIDFGGLQSGESGTSAKWYPTDFIPAIKIVELITKILSPYTISSSWLSTSFVKDLFILARETIAPESFIKSKALEANCSGESGNSNTVSVAASASGTASLTDHVILFSNVITDEGVDYSGPTGQYVVPETGTYRLYTTVKVLSNGNTSPFTETNGNMTLTIKQTGSATRTLKTVTAGSIVNNSSHVLDSGYCYLVVGDIIKVQTTMYTTATNGGGSPADLIVDIEGTSEVKLIWGNANRYSGLNKTISLEEMLPDMLQIDFLAAIRDIFLLRFWMDKQKRTIYIEPLSSFNSSTVIDLTSLIDYENKEGEPISKNYYADLLLKWKDDTSDEAFKEYMKYYTTSYGEKEINLSSIYTIKGKETKESPFSSILEGPCYPISSGTLNLPRIFNTFPVDPYIIFDRKTDFNMRLVEWKGLTGGLTWYYESETKTEYPKIAGVTWTYIYENFWLKPLHWIDKGKIYTYRMKIKPSYLNQFFTVVASASSEGFRPIYKVGDNYYYLQKITSDGITAELEMILKS